MFPDSIGALRLSYHFLPRRCFGRKWAHIMQTPSGTTSSIQPTPGAPVSGPGSLPSSDHRADDDAGRAGARELGQPSFELKGTVASLTVLRLRTGLLRVIERDLRQRLEDMPQFFEGTPLVVDVAPLGLGCAQVNFTALAGLLRAFKIVPVGVSGAEPSAPPPF